ncbi:DedA family protein [Paracoccus sp. Z118]|uniref:DedA family protein n=1 Tax=Paracoccus sp. Z118 TaxID=2851017 RepID=UPI001C2CA9C8|nr:DedA family protein [Paracoccus sp. Z118]MBV0893217.1 DedA family protein [Paracoccus sp. Z118]
MFDWILSVIEGWGYPGVFALMLLENVFPPIPSEVIMPLAGYLTATGALSFIPTVLAGTAGSVVGTLLWFWLGRALGSERLKRWAARYGRWMTVSPSDIETAEGWFRRHGGAAVFLGRMVPAVRTLISVPAGIARMPMRKFLAYTIAGSLLWTLLLAGAGLLLENQYHRVADVIDPISSFVVVAVIAIYLYRVVTWKPH